MGDSYEDTLEALLKEQAIQFEPDGPGASSRREPVAGIGAVESSSVAGDDELFGGLEPPITGPVAREAARVQERPPVDIDLELGFDVPSFDTSASEIPAAFPTPIPGSFPPATPPPGTLRLGLIEDEFDPLNALDVSSERHIPPPVVSGRVPVLRGGEGPQAHAPTLIPGAWPPPRPSQPVSAVPPEARLVAYAPAPAPLPSTPIPLPSVPPVDDRRRQMLQRFEAGDYSSALVLAESLLDETPDDPTLRRYADSCNEMLRQMYRSRIGDGSQVLRIAISNEEIRSLNLDHRAGFLLSCIDGMSSIDDVLDVSGMRELEALRILYELVQENIVTPCDDLLR
ncbi:hypothetical protein [Chondromyces crocatus]|uniref:hypothetical protein n=1 Tax=Chondromyces crocatus TaxID=52 RepID=UPI0012E13BFE|nr:hypothetical protein [Chondromyces crocatus]